LRSMLGASPDVTAEGAGFQLRWKFAADRLLRRRAQRRHATSDPARPGSGHRKLGRPRQERHPRPAAAHAPLRPCRRHTRLVRRRYCGAREPRIHGRNGSSPGVAAWRAWRSPRQSRATLTICLVTGTFVAENAGLAQGCGHACPGHRFAMAGQISAGDLKQDVLDWGRFLPQVGVAKLTPPTSRLAWPRVETARCRAAAVCG